jgi:FMN phosphatase YigB (HAD superfamily)
LRALLPVTAVLASAELGVLKDDDRFWSLAAERVGVGTLLDDDLGNVTVARRCGWGAVHFTGRDGWVDEVARALGRSDRISP